MGWPLVIVRAWIPAVVVAVVGCTKKEAEKGGPQGQSVAAATQPSQAPAPLAQPEGTAAGATATSARVRLLGAQQAGLTERLNSATLVTTCALDRIDRASEDANGARIARNEPAVFHGWAADVPGGSVPPEVRVIFEGEQGRYEAVGARGPQRPDVAAVFKHPSLVAAGFVADLDLRDVKPGQYRVKLLQVLANGNATVCDTNRVATVL